jgi:nucleotide-binding universal stress UspA family protein
MKILIPYDGSEPAKAAIADLARAGLPDDVAATVLSVADVWLPPAENTNGEDRVDSIAVTQARAKAFSLLEEAKQLSEEGASIARAQFPGWLIRNEAAADSPAWAVIKRSGATDLVVIGARGQSGLSRLIFGSISHKVVMESECSVRIGRKGRSGSGGVRIIVGIDGSNDAQAALAEIGSRAWPQNSEIRVLTSIDTNIATAAAIPGAPIASWLEDSDENETIWVSRMLDDACARIGLPGLNVSSKILEGDPKVALIEEADHWGADVIFVGAQGHSLIERLMLGSVSSAIAVRAHCSVEIIRRRTAAS